MITAKAGDMLWECDGKERVGKLPMSLQPALLGAIQCGEYKPVGSGRSEIADVRFMAATNREVTDLVTEGCFREDLYHRIATFSIHVPPLRERGQDVLLLAKACLNSENEKRNPSDTKHFSESALERLLHHDWSGNVRELENVVIRLVTLVDGTIIDGPDVDHQIRPIGKKNDPELRTLDLGVLERSADVQALKRNAGNRSKAAAELDVAVKTFYNKIRHHGITSEEWGGS